MVIPLCLELLMSQTPFVVFKLTTLGLMSWQLGDRTQMLLV
jgi:hypothetical protein